METLRRSINDLLPNYDFRVSEASDLEIDLHFHRVPFCIAESEAWPIILLLYLITRKHGVQLQRNDVSSKRKFFFSEYEPSLPSRSLSNCLFPAQIALKSPKTGFTAISTAFEDLLSYSSRSTFERNNPIPGYVTKQLPDAEVAGREVP
jgi:hypothetical protein